MATTPTTPSPSGAAAGRDRGTGTTFTRWLGVATLASMALVALFGLVLSPADVVQGESVRILYVHVGTVWVAYVAFVVTAVSSAAYLWKRTSSLTWDRIAGASAEIGVLFMAVTLLTGALWGRLSWGTFWVWDARVTTTAFLFISYVGYLAVRGLGGSHQQRARRSAVVALLAVLEIPLVHLSVLLDRIDQAFLHIVGRNRPLGDLAQRDDGVLVVVGRDSDGAAVRDGAGAMRRQKDQFEAVGDLIDAIFDGDAGHGRVLVCWKVRFSTGALGALTLKVRGLFLVLGMR